MKCLLQRLRQFLFRALQPRQRNLDGLGRTLDALFGARRPAWMANAKTASERDAYLESVVARRIDEPRGRVRASVFVCVACRRDDFVSGAELVTHRCHAAESRLVADLGPRLSVRTAGSEAASEGGGR